ncbi:MAG: ribonuclease HII [Clostridia bacterium]|nr:ribonuclease HII [Clostridia bacterium]
MLEYEQRYLEQGYQNIAGIDEVGRGPLAGPVCAAAVILPPGLVIDGINDSKKLTEKKREALYDIIAKEAVAWATAYVSPEVIDQINIRQATHKAMQMAVEALKIPADFLLVDGNDRIPFDTESEYIIKGDAKSQSIAAASIMAKVTRDRYMVEMDSVYPGYGFAKNKGYGTKVHMEGIRSIGLCPIHRRSFITPKVLGIHE